MKSNVTLSESDISEIKSKLLLNNVVPKEFIIKSGKAFEWIWLPSSNIKDLLKIRNAEHVTKNMRKTSPITEADHLDFLKSYDSLQRIDFILRCKKTSKYVGGMNISLTEYGFEIGKYIGNVDFLGMGLSFPMSVSFLQFVKENFDVIKKIYSVTKLTNHRNINLNFKLGFKITQLVEDNYWLMELE